MRGTEAWPECAFIHGVTLVRTVMPPGVRTNARRGMSVRWEELAAQGWIAGKIIVDESLANRSPG
jgi:hypothetical protein